MASIIFKRLFEIQILHEYYLMQENGLSIFDKSRAEWDSFLEDKIKKERYNIHSLLQIEPTENCKNSFKNYGIRFMLNPTGFATAIAVNPDLKTPCIKLDRDIVFQFIISRKSRNFSSITNEDPGKGFYYFSNLSSQNSRIAPTLSNPIADFNTKKKYQMGELARTAGKIQLAKKSTNSSNAANWMPLSTEGEKQAYVNEQDRCQFKLKTIHYQPNEPIKTITAALFEGHQIEIPRKTIQLTFNSPVQSVVLDFSKDDQSNEIPDGFYQLRVSYNDTFKTSELIYFSNELSALRPYALIEISTNGVGDFKILDNEKIAISPNGKHPCFQILFKSRATYWRYRSNKNKKLTKPDNYDFLVQKGKDIISLNPRLLSADATSFQRASNLERANAFLPNPSATMLQQGDNVFYSDVFVSKL